MSAVKDSEVVLDFGIQKAVRCPWSSLQEPRRFKDEQGRESGEPKYDATFLIPNDHPELKKLKSECVRIARERFGADVDLKTLKFPFSNGDEQALKASARDKDHSFCEGMVVLKTSSQYEVPVFDARQKDSSGNPVLVAKDAIKSTVYGGCFVAAQVKFRTYKVGSNQPGVTAYLQKVCFVHDGDRIGGSADGSTFAAVQGAVTNEDPTGGAGMPDDDIPF